MLCIKCGLVKRGNEDFFICDDCLQFSPVVQEIFEEIHQVFENQKTIDPQTNKLLSLIGDGSFITQRNPQTAIYYKLSEFIVAQAFDGKERISEEELNRNVTTTRSWNDILVVFEDLGLIKVTLEKYRRVLVLTKKTKNMAVQFRSGEPTSKQVQLRLAHIYAGYVLLYILSLIASANNISDIEHLPYKQRPKTLWTVLMFLWLTAYDKNEQFTEEDMRYFISKRRIPSTTRGKITRALQAMDGRTVQGLIKDISFKDGERTFTFEDYVSIEMERIRENVRKRTR